MLSIRLYRTIVVAVAILLYALPSAALKLPGDSVRYAPAVALKTNLLYDALLVPNVGAEVALGDRWTVGADIIYAWWSRNSRHRYWRVYGADAEVRYWLGERCPERRFCGHHVGAYAQAVTYDFEFGGKGRMGGKPGASIFGRAMFGAGITYGYSWLIGKALNLDLTLGAGYLGGDYQEYHPDQGCYVYDRTRRLRYFGPTRAEVSLVWLVGHSKKKGGSM